MKGMDYIYNELPALPLAQDSHETRFMELLKKTKNST